MEMNSKVTSQFIETVMVLKLLKLLIRKITKRKTDKLYRKFLKGYLTEAYYLLASRL